MKRISLIAVLCLLVSTAALIAADKPAATTSQADRDKAVGYLNETKEAFLKSIDGLSEEQWRYKPAPDRWSVAEVAEHIALSEDLLGGTIKTQVMTAPAPTAEQVAAMKGKDDAIMPMLTDRSKKFQAPEPLKPQNKWATRDELVKAFNTSRDANIEFVKTVNDDMRAHVLKAPAGDMDGIQWVIFMAAHSKRHTLQIEEVKADPNFPKK
jgi:hypothetical protein